MLTLRRALYEPDATHPDGSVTNATRTEVLHSVGRFFKPELINRLDELLVFNKLPPFVILDIVDLRLREVQSRLVGRRITMDVSEEAKIWLANKGYSETFGARAVQRVIRDKVVTRVAGGMLDGSIKDGKNVRIAVVDDDIAVSSSQGGVNAMEGHGASVGGSPRAELEVLDDMDEEAEEEAATRSFA